MTLETRNSRSFLNADQTNDVSQRGHNKSALNLDILQIDDFNMVSVRD